MKYPELKLADLELDATLGTGSFGRVRLCKHKDGKHYALKILKKTEVLYLKQVQQGLRSAASLNPRCRRSPCLIPRPCPHPNPPLIPAPPWWYHGALWVGSPALTELIRAKRALQVEHVKTEKKILEEIDHVNIVNMLGAFQDDKRAARPPPSLYPPTPIQVATAMSSSRSSRC